ncbi:MAG: nucleoside hydrolase [Thermoflexales bacterium]|nr:nucleoside hydrolase [Thermoflexales bacterium]
MPWVIDTDAGVDDAIGLMMALASTNFDLAAITTVNGNVPLERVNVNVGAVLDLVGAPIPIYAGCDRPMVQPVVRAEDFHGADGLGDAGLSRTTRTPHPQHAALAISALARQHAGNLGIIALGPLTNLALACNLDPDLPMRCSQVVVMGCAWQARGNQTPVAEFNVAADPESARVVFDRFERITVLPWETALDQMMPFEQLAQIASGSSPRAQFFAAMTRIVQVWRQRFHLPGVPLPDPLAVAVALDERVITESIHARVHIDTSQGIGRGLSAIDPRHPSPNARIVTRVDAERAWAMIASAWA